MRPSRARRPGTTFLELMVAMVVFGIAVAGLCPLVVMQSRVMRKIEAQPVGSSNLQLVRGVRMLDGAPFGAAPSPTVLQPPPDAWVRRLGVAATFADDAPAEDFTPLPAQATLDDDAGAGFSASGWSTTTDASANDGDYHSVPAASASGAATWTFALAPGRYRMRASWVPDPSNARDATYAFNDATGNTFNVVLDQTTSPGGAPPYWTDLGTYYLGASLQVALGPSLTGRVMADGIQLVPTNTVAIQTPPTTSNGAWTVGVTVTKTTPQ